MINHDKNDHSDPPKWFFDFNVTTQMLYTTFILRTAALKQFLVKPAVQSDFTILFMTDNVIR